MKPYDRIYGSEKELRVERTLKEIAEKRKKKNRKWVVRFCEQPRPTNWEEE